MKATIEIPDDLFREAKASAALEGIRLKDFVAESLRLRLQTTDGGKAKKNGARRAPKPGGLFADGCGIVNSGIGDLASNPKHMEGFGRE